MNALQSAVELYDGFTGPLNNIISALNHTVAAFTDMQRVSAADVDTSSIDAAVENINRATLAVQALEEQLAQTSGEQIQPPFQWQSDNLPVFTGTGIERFQQEVESTNNLLNNLNATQQRINQQAAATNILPPDAIADLNGVQTRIQAVAQRIQQIENNPINMGTDEANAELEQLRAQLSQAMSAQEALNTAVDEMDVERANAAYLRLSEIVGGTERYIRDNANEQGQFNRLINQGANAASGLSDMIRKAVTAFGAFASIRSVFGFVQDSMNLFNTQLNAETQLASVLGNMIEEDVGGAFDSITAKAAEIQSKGIYGDEAMIAGAAELATYFTDPEAITSMMDTLSNYAMGMSGGGELDATAMTDYATNLGKIMSGAYDAMTKKGFEFTDAQKAIIEGTATEQQYIEALGEDYASMSEDMQAATVINDIIAESWDGLYQSMSATPEGKIIALNNAFGDLKETVGAGVYPYIIQIVDYVNSNWPTIEIIISNITLALQVVIGILGAIANAALETASFFIDNWGWISPIIYGVVAALTAYYGAMLLYNAITGISTAITTAKAFAEQVHAAATMMETGATFAATAAQYGFNAALLACPITWIIVAIIAVIAAIYAVVGAINKLTGSTISATGIIAGLFATLGAHIINTFVVPVWNQFAAIANFFGNVFNNPVAAVEVLFYDMCLTVIGYIANLAHAIENLLNKIPGVTVDITSGLDNFYNGLEQAQQAVKDESGWVEYVQKMDYIDYGEAWDAGYSFGEGIDDSIASFDPASLFGVSELPSAEDYASAYVSSGPGMDLANDVSNIAGNTGSIADSLDVTEDELKYMRDIAEQETINRFTTADININMGGVSNYNNGTDLDGFIDAVVEGVNEAVEIGSEGVHK